VKGSLVRGSLTLKGAHVLRARSSSFDEVFTLTPTLTCRVLKYFELGPGSFDEVFPLLAAFLEFSHDEQRRAKTAHLAHLEGTDPSTLWGLLGSGILMKDSSPGRSTCASSPKTGVRVPGRGKAVH
jgi:hypothetical protein